MRGAICAFLGALGAAHAMSSGVSVSAGALATMTTSTPKCNAPRETSRLAGVIMDGGEADSQYDLDCTWVVHAPQYYTVDLTFDAFDVEYNKDCPFDYLEVRDGCDEHGRVVVRSCGLEEGQSLPTVSTTSSCAYIRFRTDVAIKERQLAVMYRAAPPPVQCGEGTKLVDGECVPDEGDGQEGGAAEGSGSATADEHGATGAGSAGGQEEEESGAGSGADAEEGSGADAEEGSGADAEEGSGADAEEGSGADAEEGSGADAEEGSGADAEEGSGADAEEGSGAGNVGDGPTEEDEREAEEEVRQAEEEGSGDEGDEEAGASTGASGDEEAGEGEGEVAGEASGSGSEAEEGASVSEGGKQEGADGESQGEGGEEGGSNGSGEEETASDEDSDDEAGSAKPNMPDAITDPMSYKFPLFLEVGHKRLLRGQ